MNAANDGWIIIAIEDRRSCFGYAVFQGPMRLLDWGATTPYPLEGAIQRARKRFLSLLLMFTPEVVVMRKPLNHKSRDPIRRLLKRETADRSIPMGLLARDDIHQAFGTFCTKNKYEIAEALTRIFPELIDKLPPPRDIGDSERRAMSVFDAVATGYAYMKDRIT
jgi:hypothetical protein